MSWWRRSGIARLVVVGLLSWTAADLANASLCALDHEQELAASPASGPTVLTAAHAPSGQAADEPMHVDDCFCCSHCVELSRLLPAIDSEPAAPDAPTPVTLVPRLFGLQLYHPPLA